MGAPPPLNTARREPFLLLFFFFCYCYYRNMKYKWRRHMAVHLFSESIRCKQREYYYSRS